MSHTFRAILILSFLALTSCSEETSVSEDPTQPPPTPSQCGDKHLDPPEICDGALGLPDSCSAWDDKKIWAEGGAPACADDCGAIVAGSCREVTCGDGFLDTPEICDGTLGLPDSCSAWDDKKIWAEGGAPACADDCGAIVAGSCKPAPLQLDIINWNILFEYNAWGGSTVLPRAQIFYDILSTYDKRPDFISVAEASQQWHYPEVTELLDALGYAWADPTPPNDDDSGYFMTEVLYRKDRFEKIDQDFVTLYPYTDEGDRRHKCISFAAVFREIATDAEFIIMSTHWDANIESETCKYVNNIAGPIIMRERNRVQGALQTVELIKTLSQKYPKAHIFYGGDLNTIDFNIIYASPLISDLLGDTPKKVIDSANMLYINAEDKPCGEPFEDNFIGAFEVFSNTSGLYSARDQALATNVYLNDISSINRVTADASSMGDILNAIIKQLINVKLIIDYAFYSPGMTLIEYEVMSGEDYMKISDHNPIRTRYLYYLE